MDIDKWVDSFSGQKTKKEDQMFESLIQGESDWFEEAFELKKGTKNFFFYWWWMHKIDKLKYWQVLSELLLEKWSVLVSMVLKVTRSSLRLLKKKKSLDDKNY